MAGSWGWWAVGGGGEVDPASGRPERDTADTNVGVRMCTHYAYALAHITLLVTQYAGRCDCCGLGEVGVEVEVAGFL